MTDSERIEEQELIEAEPVRQLPVRAEGRTIELWGREVASRGGRG